MGKNRAKAQRFPRIIVKWALTSTQELIGIDEIHRFDCLKIDDV